MKKAWGIIVLILIIGIAFPLIQHLLKKQEAFTPNSLIRIHIVANSNTPADQDIKLKVRDRLVNWLSPQLAASKSARDSRLILARNLEAIRETACREVKAQQANYGASVTLGEFEFPTRRYGEVVLPAGKYQALRVVLGDGEGANWWCVLYPPLCVGKAGDAEKEPQWLLSKLTSSIRKKPIAQR
ncbi:MAG: stage II sporulation protein R [Bacillota bacterium]